MQTKSLTVITEPVDLFRKAIRGMCDQELLETMKDALNAFKDHIAAGRRLQDQADREWLVSLLEEWDLRHCQ